MKTKSLYISLFALVVVGTAFGLWATGTVSIPNLAVRAPAAAPAPPPASVSVAPALQKTVTEWY
jgi:hypothetical protein